MKLIITIDTEEDNWADYSSRIYTVKNIERIPALQQLFDDFKVRPTYLITYPVATNGQAISILKRIVVEDKCEIGSHCHPWSTPPFVERNTRENSMLCNLTPELQYQKLSNLHQVIKDNLGVKPVSFRSGRWGFNQEVAKNIHKLGYRIDTSVTPFMDWSSSYGPDYSDIPPKTYKLLIEDVSQTSHNGYLLEVPATIGFLQRDFDLANRIHKVSKKIRMNGILYRLKMINKVWFSPEVSEAKEMIKLAKRCMASGYAFINMVFHSPSLVCGLTPFVKSPQQEEEFLRKIRECLVSMQDMGIEPVRLSDCLTDSYGFSDPTFRGIGQ